MKAQRFARAVLLGTVIILMSCGGPSGVEGKSGVWLKGKALSLKVTFTTVGVLLELRNDSEREVKVSPVRLIVWGGSSGKQEIQFSMGESGKDPVLKPHESTTLPPLGSADATRVRVFLGPEGSKEQEVFTVTQ